MAKSSEITDMTNAFVSIVIILSVLGLGNIIPIATKIFTKLIIGAVTGMVTASLVESFGGNILRKISWNVEVFGLNISITAFVVATQLTELILF